MEPERSYIDPHAHIGSIRSGGMRHPVGFETDFDPRWAPGPTSLLDLLCSPYFHGLLLNSGFEDPHPSDAQYAALTREQRYDYLQRLLPYFKANRLSGLSEAYHIAFRDLYDADLTAAFESQAAFDALDEQVEERYLSYGKWLGHTMERGSIEWALKPVHLPYLRSYDGKGDGFHIPILRIDDLIGRSSSVITPGSNWSAIFPKHREEWSLPKVEELIEEAFALIDLHAVPAIKSAIAYERNLAFPRVSRADALSSFYSDGEVERVQSYLLHRVLEEANERGLPFQVHCGMAPCHRGEPSTLEPLFDLYPGVRFVLLHSYPYERYTGYLARTYRNVYLDAAWLALLGRAVLSGALSQWLSFVPANKIMLSSDATSAEEAYGAWVLMDDVLRKSLEMALTEEGLAGGEIERLSARLLRGNSEELYYGNRRNSGGPR